MRHLKWCLALVPLFASCASVKPPTLAVEGLKIGNIGITSATMNVRFKVRNPNSDPLYIERFEYELFLNGHRLGRGFEPDPLSLDGFREERVVSRFDLNFLHLPGAVKRLLDQDRAEAQVKGIFYVRDKGHGAKQLHFEAEAAVDIHQDHDRDRDRHHERDRDPQDENDRPPS